MGGLLEAGAAVALAITLLIAVRDVIARRRSALPFGGAAPEGLGGGPAVAAYLRLLLWTALVCFWLALTGALAVAATSQLLGVPPTTWMFAAGGLLGVGLVTALQFLRQLVWMPGALCFAANLDLSRFYPLWRRLGVSRMRWLVVLGAILLAGPVLLWIAKLLANGEHAKAAQVGALAALLAAPWVWEVIPERGGRRSAGASKGARPNVLMIGCSALGADAVGCFGNGTGFTPFLDALASRGSAFSRCYTPVARTAPSLASWLGGRWPRRLNRDGQVVLGEAGSVTGANLATALAAAGYGTAMLSDWPGKDVATVAGGFGKLDMPRERRDAEGLIRQGSTGVVWFLTLFAPAKFGRIFLPELHFQPELPVAHHLVPQALRRLEDLQTDGKPWLLHLFLETAQPPFVSRYPYYTLYRDVSETLFRSPRPLDGRELESVRALYGGCVRAFDDQVRQIVQHLDHSGLADNTLIVIYGDRGTGLFEPEARTEAARAAGAAVNRVPLILVDRRFRGGRVCDEVVRTVDLLPTLLELCGAEVPSGLDGQSLASYVRGGSSVGERVAFCEAGLPFASQSDWKSGDRRNLAVIDGQWKLVYTNGREGEHYALYRLNANPAPDQDLSQQHPEEFAALRDKLSGWLHVGGGDTLSARARTG